MSSREVILLNIVITHEALMKVKPDRGVSCFRGEQRHGSVCRASSGCRVAECLDSARITLRAH